METNRFEFLRGRIEYYLTEATKKQYNGNTVQTSPEASCSNAHGGNYVENKQIARDIRVRHATDCPLLVLFLLSSLVCAQVYVCCLGKSATV